MKSVIARYSRLVSFFVFSIAFSATLAVLTFSSMAYATTVEEASQGLLSALIDKFPMVLTVYLVLSAVYQLFCVIAAITKTDKDDKVASFLKGFFSLNPPKK